MSDKIQLMIGNRQIEDFESYRISSDLFEAADAFEITLADPGLKITKGQRCQLKVNNLIELNGIIDRTTRSYKKDERMLTIEGRDLMGLVVDSYCTTWPDLQDITLKALAGQLLGQIPYVKDLPIKYGKGDKSRSVVVTTEEPDHKWTQIRPGQTVFDALKEKALQEGMLFFSLPDGTIIFGQPATAGKALFSFVTTQEGLGNNILSASLIEDLSRRYSVVKVMGQQQGDDDLDAGEHNFLAEVTDSTFPFRKPYVALIEHDGQDPRNYARIIMDGQRFDGWQLELRVPGHAQNGRNYRVNALCHVKDEKLEINKDLLCYSRTFELSKCEQSTIMRLSLPGVLPA